MDFSRDFFKYSSRASSVLFQDSFIVYFWEFSRDIFNQSCMYIFWDFLKKKCWESRIFFFSTSGSLQGPFLMLLQEVPVIYLKICICWIVQLFLQGLLQGFRPTFLQRFIFGGSFHNSCKGFFCGFIRDFVSRCPQNTSGIPSTGPVHRSGEKGGLFLKFSKRWRGAYGMERR